MRSRIMFQLLQHFKSVGIRQIDIECNQARLVGARLFQRFLRSARNANLITVAG
jgi:hypothetical protein